MASIITSQDIDDEARMGRYFLSYQRDWILDESEELLGEKAVRVGWTYGDGFKRVRRGLTVPNLDYLFVSKDQPTAFEYVETCAKFLEAYNLTSSIISKGIEDIDVPVFDVEAGRNTQFTESVKVGSIRFDNGSRILAFSSNPNAVRAYGGDVGWDEAAHHPNDRRMWAALQGRAAWGFRIAEFSSHNGEDTLFAEHCDEAKEEDSKVSYYYCDLPTAIEAGLVEKINQVSGSKFTREEFMERAKRRAKFAHGEENLCERSGAASSLIKASEIKSAQDDAPMPRAHIGDHSVSVKEHAWVDRTACAVISREFGEPTKFNEDGGPRKRKLEQWLRQAFSDLFDLRKQKGFNRWRVGFDVAASGQGDLACVYIDKVTKSGELALSGILTTRTEDWQIIKWSLWYFMAQLPGQVLGAGDETGLGKQICWETIQRYHGLFVGVNFSGQKSALGSRLMVEFSDGVKRIPKDHPDIAADYRALKKTKKKARKAGETEKYVITQGKNKLNILSHCDIAFAGALSSHAHENLTESQGFAFTIES